jgi:hypothetical protein
MEFRLGAGGTSRILDTAFEDCSGGIFAEDFIGSLAMKGCDFRRNGFGVDVDGATVGRFTLESCVFEDNLEFGADLRGEENRVVGSTFRENDTLGDFGGLYLLRGSVEDCVFEGNRARNAGGLAGRNVTVSRCTFRGNHAVGFGEEDGFGGAMILEGGSTVVEDCLFLANRAGNGAAIVLRDPTLVRDCTFAFNRGYHSSVFHLGVSNFRAERILVFGNLDGPPTNCEDGARFLISCSDFYGNQAGDWTGCAAESQFQDGNISSDPLFCDAESEDFTLASGSPCLAENNGCGDMGAFGQGCEPTPIQDTSWGVIKSKFTDRP